MNTVLTTDQVSNITNILTQYAPDGWTSLKMHLVTDETHTELTTWAETKSNPKHGFRLDPEDRPVLDELIDAAWESSGRAWNTLDFAVTADGDFELNAQ